MDLSDHEETQSEKCLQQAEVDYEGQTKRSAFMTVTA